MNPPPPPSLLLAPCSHQLYLCTDTTHSPYSLHFTWVVSCLWEVPPNPIVPLGFIKTSLTMQNPEWGAHVSLGTMSPSQPAEGQPCDGTEPGGLMVLSHQNPALEIGGDVACGGGIPEFPFFLRFPAPQSRGKRRRERFGRKRLCSGFLWSAPGEAFLTQAEQIKERSQNTEHSSISWL